MLAHRLQSRRTMRWSLLLAVFAATCTARSEASPAPAPSSVNPSICRGLPVARSTEFRHRRSKLLARLGSPRHRGIDLIAMEGDENQTLGGKLAYTKANKDLEDEDVEIFACRGRTWRSLGTARTNDDGRFELVLAGARRLPAGMTELHARVLGDGSSISFLGFVAAKGESVVVTDIDGTITASEKAMWRTVVLGSDIGHQPSAPQALARSGRTVIYLSARGDQYTEVTRRWLRAHGFPVGPIRLASSFATIPGKRTVAFKTRALRSLRVPIAAGVGNRASDIAAYQNAGLTANRIFINLPEFTNEVRNDLSAGKATAFDDYRDLPRLLSGM